MEEAWALAARWPPPGKLRNDNSRFALDLRPRPSCPLYLSSPFFHQTARNQTYTQGFFLFYLYFLKTFNVMNECVRAQVTNVCRWALKSCVHVYILCESIRDLYFPLSLSYHSSRGKVKTTLSVCTVILTEKAGFAIQWEIADVMSSAANPCQQVACVYLWRGEVLCFPCPLYCKISNTGVCMCVCACVHDPACLSENDVSASLNRKEHVTSSQKSKYMLAHQHTHKHTHAYVSSDSYEPEL